MPELPEVEVIRQFLTPKLVGLSFIHLDILNPGSFSGQPRLFLGQKITALSRLGKQLSIHFGPKLSLLVHLKMTGQLIYQDQSSSTTLGHASPRRSSHTRLIFTLSDSSKLFFNDMRKFGWIRLLKTYQLKKFQANLGPDLLSPKFTPSYFRRQLRSSSRPVKSLLHDQNRFAGIGNIYANDALFLAGIHPLTPSNKISSLKSKKLHLYLLQIINQSVKAGGSTARDNQYLRPDASPGTNQYHFRVYQRQGQPCLVCSTPIEKIKVSGRSTFFCPHCQNFLQFTSSHIRQLFFIDHDQ